MYSGGETTLYILPLRNSSKNFVPMKTATIPATAKTAGKKWNGFAPMKTATIPVIMKNVKDI